MIHIDPKVVDYLHHKHSHCLTIKTLEVSGGCAIPVEPQIETKPPLNVEKYLHYEIDGIDVYVKKGVDLDPEVYFKLSNVLGLKSIHATGLNFM